MQESSAVPEEWQWVSVGQAVIMTGLSAATIRRRIRDGAPVTLPDGSVLTFQAERLERPQGSTFLVRLPATLGAPPADDASGEESAAVSPEPPAVPMLQVEDLEKLLSNLGQQWLEPVLAEMRGAHARELVSAEQIGILRLRLELALKAGGEVAEERDQYQERAEKLAGELAVLQTEVEGLRLAREIATNVDEGRTVHDWAVADAGDSTEPQRRWWQRLFDWI